MHWTDKIEEVLTWHKNTFKEISKKEQENKAINEHKEFLDAKELKEKIDEYVDFVIASIAQLRFSIDCDKKIGKHNINTQDTKKVVNTIQEGYKFYTEDIFIRAFIAKLNILKKSKWQRINGEWKREK